MKFLSMYLKRILSIVLVLTLQMQTVSSSTIVGSTPGKTLSEPTTSLTIGVSVDGGHGTAVADLSSVEPGQSALITITPDVGYHIAGVTDNSADVLALVISGVYTLTDVQIEHQIVVTFAINEYTLDLSVQTPSTGLVNGVETLTWTSTHGSEITLVAVPASGYVFLHWLVNGDEAGSDPTYVLTLDGPKTVVAVFGNDPDLVKAQELVTFFEENTVLGTLTGLGKTEQAQKNRLKAFLNKLNAVVHALEAGETQDAVGLLTSTLAKVDGELNPPDFIGGDQSDELKALIQALIDQLPELIVEDPE